MKPRVSLVYDWVTSFGGAERLLLALKQVFPDAPLYTGVYRPKQAIYAQDFDVRPQLKGPLSYLPAQLTAWTMPWIFESIPWTKTDIVISVTSGPALSIVTPANVLHLSIILTPSRYFWHLKDDPSVVSAHVKPLLTLLGPLARSREYLAAQRPDHLIAISQTVAQRVRRYYRREPRMVLYPPTHYSSLQPTPLPKEPQYLVVGRLVAYKRVEAIIEAANQLKRPLTIIGEGPERKRLATLKGPTVRLMGAVSEAELSKAYHQASAIVFVSEEDFGIVPVEAMAHGRPVICLSRGGAAETVIKGVSGIHIDSPDPRQIMNGMIECEATDFEPKACQKAAARFSMQRFTSQVRQVVEETWADHLQR